MNSQFSILIIIGLIFVLNFLAMKTITATYVPYGIRAILGSCFMIMSLLLAVLASTYGR